MTGGTEGWEVCWVVVIVTGLTCFAGFTATMARIALGINGVGDEAGLAVLDVVSKADLNQSVGMRLQLFRVFKSSK